MKFAVSRVAASVAVVFLAACSSVGLETKKVEYKSAGKAPTLETPPDLIAPARDDRFAVPDGGGKGRATFSAYANERSSEARAARGRRRRAARRGTGHAAPVPCAGSPARRRRTRTGTRSR